MITCVCVCVRARAHVCVYMCTVYMFTSWCISSYTSSIDHLVMKEFVSGPSRYHLVIKGVREQFVVSPSACRTVYTEHASVHVSFILNTQ